MTKDKQIRKQARKILKASYEFLELLKESDSLDELSGLTMNYTSVKLAGAVGTIIAYLTGAQFVRHEKKKEE